MTATTPSLTGQTSHPPRTLTVAFIGNPNTGKSTLFNALAGMHARVGNYPGVTVEKKIGRVRVGDTTLKVVDLPGTYSLAPRSLDEMVSVEVLLGRQADVGRLDAVACIVDASNLERNLFLVSQVLDVGLPTVLILNMSDVARQRGTSIDVPALSQRLGIPIVTTEAHRRVGIEAVRQALLDAAESKRPAPKPVFPAAFYAAVDEVARDLRPVNGEALPRYLVERLLLDPNGQIEKWLTPTQPAGFTERVAQIRDRLAKDGFRLPAAEARTRYAAIREVVSGVLTHAAQPATTTSDRIDRVLTHRVSGLLVFAGIMFVVFQSIYYWAEPFMRSIEWTEGLIKGGVESLIGPGALRSLVVDGVVAGVGGVLVFLPQIVFLFLFIAVLEDCGYMARAAFLMDRLMSRLGLSGKSFIPLMSSFALRDSRRDGDPRDRKSPRPDGDDSDCPIDELLRPLAGVSAVDLGLCARGDLSGRLGLAARARAVRDVLVGSDRRRSLRVAAQEDILPRRDAPLRDGAAVVQVAIPASGVAPGLRSGQGLRDAGRHADLRHVDRGLGGRLFPRQSQRTRHDHTADRGDARGRRRETPRNRPNSTS